MAESVNKIYPFKFLNAYERSDAEIFFGREEEKKALYDMASQNPVVVVYGASGTGKTSLIQCGLAGKFKSYDWLPITVRRNSNINDSLADALDKAGGNATHFENEADLEDEPALSDLAKKVKGVYLSNFKTIYLIFDQFEELYILGNNNEEDTFIAAIKEILTLKQPVKIIFSIREEYLGYLFSFEKKMPQLLRKKIRVEPMTKDDLDEILKGINTSKNLVLSFDKNTDEISNAIADKLKGDNKTLTIELPYLQVFLENLYQKLTNDKTHKTETIISLQSVLAMDDIGDVLKKFLEDQAEEVRLLASNNKSTGNNPTLETIWKILSPFATLEGTKDPITKNEIEGRIYDTTIDTVLIDFCVSEFVKRRILNYAEETGRYELAHDSLAKCLAGKRNPDDIRLLEVRRLINYQVSIKEGVRELFTEKQMKVIHPFLGQLKLTKDEEKLISDSQDKIRNDIAKRRNIRYAISFAVFLASLFVAWLFYKQNADYENEVMQKNLDVLNNKITKANEKGNYLHRFLYTVEALTLIKKKDEKISDSLIAKALKGAGFSRYILSNIFHDNTLPVFLAQFSKDEKKIYSASDEIIKKEWQIDSDNESRIFKDDASEFIPKDTIETLFNRYKREFLDTLGEDVFGIPYFLSLPGHILTIYGASYSNDATQVLTWGKNTESIYDAVDFWTSEGINANIPALVHDGVEGAVFSSDNSMVLTWGSDSTIRVWRYVSDTTIFRLPADLMKMKSQVETGVKVSEADLTTIQIIPYSEYISLRKRFLELYNAYQEKQKKNRK